MLTEIAMTKNDPLLMVVKSELESRGLSSIYAHNFEGPSGDEFKIALHDANHSKRYAIGRPERMLEIVRDAQAEDDVWDRCEAEGLMREASDSSR